MSRKHKEDFFALDRTREERERRATGFTIRGWGQYIMVNTTEDWIGGSPDPILLKNRMEKSGQPQKISQDTLHSHVSLVPKKLTLPGLPISNSSYPRNPLQSS
eukprot:TRINITY_DN16827_c0_g1_i1.p1 TRINITY_DN16827_c0_g1~~TRINITY_DN16827_c0_g1_i1.p1  ORF type:complete len:103 (-),score=3.25 TRINITY_DN16827_c0_g1_i1:317-625(-)